MKQDMAVIDIGSDHIAIHKPAVEDIERERIQQQVLDGALERTCAINRIVALVADEFLGGFC